METEIYKLTIHLMTPMLGSQPTKAVASEFLAKKAGMESLPSDEDAMLPEMLERGTTVFHHIQEGPDKGKPAIMNYHLLGFLKESAKVQNGEVDGKIKALRSKVASQVFISPRVIPLNVPDAAVPEGVETESGYYLERPLRAETAQGPRNALARSEVLPEGTWFTCNLEVFGKNQITENVIRDLLDYGFYRGLGQWRNSGAYGTFRYELVKQDN